MTGRAHNPGQSLPSSHHGRDENVSFATAAENSTGLFDGLFDEAERARWRMTDLPWDTLERAAVRPALVALVREIALSEMTTFSASRRFLNEFSDDVEFTQWMAVWFYEETKHPLALTRWLAHFGSSFDDATIVRARASAPFMKSRMATLVMNVVSEMVATAHYVGLAKHVKEPVLREIARNLAADEARHARTFLAFAKKRLASASDPAVERLDAVKVLYFWLCENGEVRHPVSLLYGEARADPELGPLLEEMPIELERVAQRVCAQIGQLIGVPIDGPAEIRSTLRQLVAESRRAGGGHETA
jgi:hypothetical protein